MMALKPVRLHAAGTRSSASIPDSQLARWTVGIATALSSGAPLHLLRQLHGPQITSWWNAALILLGALTGLTLGRSRALTRRPLTGWLLIGAGSVATVFSTDRTASLEWFFRNFWATICVFMVLPFLGKTAALRWVAYGLFANVVLSLGVYMQGDVAGRLDYPFFNGVWLSRNSLGHAATLCGVVSFVFAWGRWGEPGEAKQLAQPSRTRNLVMTTITMLSFVAVWLSRSKTPFLILPIVVAGLLLGIAVSIFAAWRVGRTTEALRLVGIAGVWTAVTGGVLVIAWLVHPELRASSSQFVTLTERTSLWRVAGTRLGERPLSGYGFGNVFMTRFGAELSALTKWPSAHLHNGFYDAFAAGGVLLLLPLIIVCMHAVFVCFRPWLRGSDPLVAARPTVIVLAALALNITEPDFLSTLPSTLTLLWIITMNAGGEVRLSDSPDDKRSRRRRPFE
jgi:O-Antigen ligase